MYPMQEHIVRLPPPVLLSWGFERAIFYALPLFHNCRPCVATVRFLVQAHEPGPSAEIYKAFSMPWLFLASTGSALCFRPTENAGIPKSGIRHPPLSRSISSRQAGLLLATEARACKAHDELVALDHLARLVSPPVAVLVEEMVIGRLARNCTPSCDGVVLSVSGNVASPCATASTIPHANGYDVRDDGASKSALRLSAWMVSVMRFTKYSRMRIVSRLTAVVRPLSRSGAGFGSAQHGKEEDNHNATHDDSSSSRQLRSTILLFGLGPAKKFPFLPKIKEYPAPLTPPMAVTAVHFPPGARAIPRLGVLIYAPGMYSAQFQRDYLPYRVGSTQRLHPKSVVGGVTTTFQRLYMLEIDGT
ncbi:hypothetical protein CPB85DRAFT_1255535 [Mucidula mucida]|nr:hypothetical protein CPB85DRAFT_1255535 [Mucidula mucida]